MSPGELAALRDKIGSRYWPCSKGVGVATVVGGILIGLRRESRGLSIAVAGLIIDLTVVNLLVFYQDQFKALIGTALQYIVFVAAFSYRRIYLEDEGESAGQAEDAAQTEFAEAIREVSVESATLAPGAS